MMHREWVENEELFKFFEGFKPMKDCVNHPDHYKAENGLEAIDVIEAFNLDFNMGNAVKYILRAGKKDDECQDLKKAMWYLKREISMLEEVLKDEYVDD